MNAKSFHHPLWSVGPISQYIGGLGTSSAGGGGGWGGASGAVRPLRLGVVPLVRQLLHAAIAATALATLEVLSGAEETALKEWSGQLRSLFLREVFPAVDLTWLSALPSPPCGPRRCAPPACCCSGEVFAAGPLMSAVCSRRGTCCSIAMTTPTSCANISGTPPTTGPIFYIR
jgi:hypothetical protein